RSMVMPPGAGAAIPASLSDARGRCGTTVSYSASTISPAAARRAGIAPSADMISPETGRRLSLSAILVHILCMAIRARALARHAECARGCTERLNRWLTMPDQGRRAGNRPEQGRAFPVDSLRECRAEIRD